MPASFSVIREITVILDSPKISLFILQENTHVIDIDVTLTI